MPKRQKSTRVVYKWFVGELKSHTRELLEKTMAKKLDSNGEWEFFVSNMPFEDYPNYQADIVWRMPTGTGKPAMLLFEVGTAAIIEVRDPKLMPLVERFAKRWEKERLELFPELQARVRELLGWAPAERLNEGINSALQVNPEVIIIEGYL